jgi:MFS family permease
MSAVDTAGGGTAAPAAERSGGWAMLFTLSLAGALATLMAVCLYPEIVNLSTQFKQPVSSVAWSMIIVTVVGTGVGAVAAGLGAIMGNRLMLIILVACILIGGVIVGLSHSLTVLIVGRGVQGVGMGALALCMGIVATFWSGQKMRRAIGVLMTSVGIGAVVGYMLGGFIWKAGGDWRTLFWAVVGISAVTLVLLFTTVKETKRIKGVPIDYVGVIGLLVWSVLILIPLSQANSWGWGSSKVLELLLPGIVVLILWVVWELRISTPLLDLRILAHMGVWQGALLWFAIAIALYMSSTFVPYLFQTPHALGGYGFGKDIFMVSLVLSMPGLLMLLLSSSTAKVMHSLNAKGTMLLGSLFGLGGFGMALAHGSVWVNFIWMGTFGVTFAWGGTAAYAVAEEAVPPQQGVIASALLTTAMNLGASIGTALTGYLLTVSTDTFKIPGVPAPTVVPAGSTFTWSAIVIGVVAALSMVAVLTINSKKFHIADREG